MLRELRNNSPQIWIPLVESAFIPHYTRGLTLTSDTPLEYLQVEMDSKTLYLEARDKEKVRVSMVGGSCDWAVERSRRTGLRRGE
jgi:hypothetical protein